MREGWDDRLAGGPPISPEELRAPEMIEFQRATQAYLDDPESPEKEVAAWAAWIRLRAAQRGEDRRG